MAFILDDLKKIDKGQLSSVYLLYGNDIYLEEEVIKTLVEVFSRSEKSQTEKIIFYGDENPNEAFIQSLSNFGMFATRRIIIYKNISKMTAGARKQLLQYLKRPEATILLILSAAGNKKSSFFDSVKRQAAVKTVSIWKPKVADFPAIIQRRLTKEGYQIDPEALGMLALSTNDSLSHSFSEIEKILVYVGDKKRITPADVRTVVGGEKNYQMSDFVNAVAEKDLYQSVRICMALIETGSKTPYFISALYSFFVNVWAFPQIHQGVKYAYYPLEQRRLEYQKAYDKYRYHDFRQLFKLLLEVDIQVKSVSLKPKELMIPLIYHLIK
ncbi:MAG: DNA polymerase III subunit delta [Candidatus Marinimicrobia bacterium]|nr:DNA polymerase III subunit delta [Candidatus Neomarinimicrobiota bacterium]